MKIYSKDYLIKNLEKEGLKFSCFSLIHEGVYAAADADWNYKDVPHLKYVHNLVNAYMSAVSDDFVATINAQKTFGMKLPLCVFNYQSGPNAQTYYTTWLFFVLIVETRYEELAPCKTRVTTSYHIGSPKLLRWCLPIIRWAIKRNYKDLMSTDIPMRERRGQLRLWGYAFKKEKPNYSFEETMNIAGTNVVAPLTVFTPVKIVLEQVLPHNGNEFLVGRADAFGFRLIRKDNLVMVFPRMCLHEGASLDNQPCKKDAIIKCPWHARPYKPLVTYLLNEAAAFAIHEQKVGDFLFHCKENVLTITREIT